MQADDQIRVLKERLLKEVARFYRRDGRRWKQPIVETLRDLQRINARAVFFGGTLRSLLVPRVVGGTSGRPRDIDIVVSGVSTDTLKEQFGEILSRETRFGGLQLRRLAWRFDVWPLQQTWAFTRDSSEEPEFSALPSTTFFNLEAIAVEAWAQPGRSREVFSGDDQFFKGILSRTLEVNLEDNPFPELCVARALILSSDLAFNIGPRLAHYIAHHGPNVAIHDLEDVQVKHYGLLRIDGRTLRTWIESVSEVHARDASAPIKLPMAAQLQQLRLWPQTDVGTQVRVHALK